jgi:hypothetical protein
LLPHPPVDPWTRPSSGTAVGGRRTGRRDKTCRRPGMPITPVGEARLVSSQVQRARAAESGETSFECQRAHEGGDPGRRADLPRGLSAKLSANASCHGRVVVLLLAQAPCASSRRRGGDADGTHTDRHTDTQTQTLTISLPGTLALLPWSTLVLAARRPRQHAFAVSLLKDGLPWHHCCPTRQLLLLPCCGAPVQSIPI